MLSLLIDLVIFVVVAGLLWWIIQQIPLPAPASQIVRVVFVVICAIFLIYMLLGVVHGAGSGYPMLR